MDRLLEKFRDRYLAAKKPATAHLDLTWMCPLSCRHCYLQQRRSCNELGTETILGVVDQLRQLGTLVVLYSGGEILLRSDLQEILSGTVERGFALRLKTTGIGAPAGFAQYLKGLGVVGVDVSFYGADAVHHDWVTRRTGSFTESLGFVRSLAAVGVQVRGVFTPLRGATTEPQQVANRLLALGVPSVAYNYYSQVGCGSLEAAELALGEELEDRFMQAAMGNGVMDETMPSLEERACYACQLSIYVAPDGQVGPCVDLPTECGNVTETSVDELWQRIRQRLDEYNPRLRERPACMRCELAKYGYYCPAQALAQTGDVRTPGSELCSTCRAVERAFRHRERRP